MFPKIAALGGQQRVGKVTLAPANWVSASAGPVAPSLLLGVPTADRIPPSPPPSHQVLFTFPPSLSLFDLIWAGRDMSLLEAWHKQMCACRHTRPLPCLGATVWASAPGLTHLYEAGALPLQVLKVASEAREPGILHIRVCSVGLPQGLGEEPPIRKELPERQETRSLTS